MYAFTQDVPIGPELYRRILDELGPEPLEGSLLHLCVRRPEGGLRYVDVWESEEACTRAFDERIHPAVDRAFGGARPTGEPEVHLLEVVDLTMAPAPPVGRPPITLPRARRAPPAAAGRRPPRPAPREPGG